MSNMNKRVVALYNIHGLIANKEYDVMEETSLSYLIEIEGVKVYLAKEFFKVKVNGSKEELPILIC